MEINKNNETGKRVAVLGVGLIGGSMAITLKKRGWSVYNYGIDKNLANLNEALELDIIDEVANLDDVLSEIDVLIIAIPVDATRNILIDILDKIKDHQLVIDLGSTKLGICEQVKSHPNRGVFVAAHPIAGTEDSGPNAAFDGLFEGKVNIICDQELSSPSQLKTALELFNLLEMKTLFMDAVEHDRHIAYVSHLSHITSFVLGQTVLEMEKDEKNIFNMAGSGFASTVRLAKSSPEMWGPIFKQNKPELSKALDTFIQNLQNFKSKIDNEDEQGLIETMKDVNRIRKVLEGIELK
jgi:prephenate dehydrogenase